MRTEKGQITNQDETKFETSSETISTTEKAGSLPRSLKFESPSLLTDEAGVLKKDERKQLENDLKSSSDTLNIDIAVIFVSKISEFGYTELMNFADDFYDFNGFGRGEKKEDGLIMAIDFESRMVWISTSGSVIRTCTDAGIDLILDELMPPLQKGDYKEAVTTYIAAVVWLHEYEKDKGFPYDT